METFNYCHDATGTRIQTETGKVSGDTPWEKMQLRTKYVDTSITRYDSDIVGVWTSQSIHLSTTDDVYAYVQTRDDGSRYLVVKLDHHDTIFVPMEIADAITAAFAAEAVAS